MSDESCGCGCSTTPPQSDVNDDCACGCECSGEQEPKEDAIA